MRKAKKLFVVPIIYYLFDFDRVLAKFGLDKTTKIDLVDKTMEELEHETALMEEKKMNHAY